MLSDDVDDTIIDRRFLWIRW